MTNPETALAVEPAVRADSGGPVVSCPGNAFVTRVRLVDGRVDEAWSTGRMVRNMNVLLRGELDARGCPRFVDQPHCLCNDGHALAAIRAVEDLADAPLPHGAVLLRRLVRSMRCIQEHLLHFYHFHLSDWVNPEAALRADPALTGALDDFSGDIDFRLVRERLAALAGTASGRMPEAGYRGADELHLLLHGHAMQAIKVGGAFQAALALLGCGPKGFRAYRLGGLPRDLDLGRETFRQLRAALRANLEFVAKIFPSDAARLARAYGAWAEQGRGSVFLAWRGDGGGLIFSDPNGGSWQLSPSDGAAVREEAEPGWSGRDRSCYRLSGGRDEPSFKWEQQDYFWLPAPRHGDIACEVGPVARVLGGWLGGQSAVMRALSAMLDRCGLPVEAMNSTLGRVLSRSVEAAALMESMLGWTDELEAALAEDDRRDATFTMPAGGTGVGRVEVPRGTLTHTITWDNGRIVAHDYLIPSLWNFSPRDGLGNPGPLERALASTPVADPEHPVEILRTLHQLDPCNECHVVVEDRDTGRVSLATA